MSGPRRPFDPAELRGPGDDTPGDAELAGVLATARELEALARADEPVTSADFTDRVMAAIATEPPPRGIAVGMAGGGVLATLRNAWQTATTGGRPFAVRAQALAFLLIIAIGATSLGTVAAVGVAGFLSPDRTRPPTDGPVPTEPSVGPSDRIVKPSPSPSPSLPTPSPSISPSPTATEEAGETDEPGETAEPTETGDDDGGSSRGSGSGSGSKTHEPDETDEPGETDEPDETPEPRETPEPTDD